MLKQFAGITVAVCVLAVVAVSYGQGFPEPLVRYDFEGDSADTVVTYSGSLLGTVGSDLNLNLYGTSPASAPVQGQYFGVYRPASQQYSGYALNNSDNGSVMGGTGGRARSDSNALTSFGNLESFTVAGWILTPAGVSVWNNAFVLSHHKNNEGFAVRCGSANSLKLYVDDYLAYESSSGSAGYFVDGRWSFFAVTWDGSNANQPAVFYRGREQDFLGDIEFVNAYTLPDSVQDLGKVNPISASGWSWLAVGNEPGGTRAFAGRLDAVAIWGAQSGSDGALSMDQIREYWLDSQRPINCDVVHEFGFGINGDLNQDCYVEWADFGIFASNWQSCNDPNDPNCTD